MFHLQQNFVPRHFFFFDPHQNFLDLRDPRDPCQNLTHATHEPMNPPYPRHLRYLADSKINVNRNDNGLTTVTLRHRYFPWKCLRFLKLVLDSGFQSSLSRQKIFFKVGIVVKLLPQLMSVWCLYYIQDWRFRSSRSKGSYKKKVFL